MKIGVIQLPRRLFLNINILILSLNSDDDWIDLQLQRKYLFLYNCSKGEKLFKRWNLLLVSLEGRSVGSLPPPESVQEEFTHYNPVDIIWTFEVTNCRCNVNTVTNIIFKLKNQNSKLISGGFGGGCSRRAPTDPTDQYFLNFMGFFRKCINILGRHSPKGLEPPAMTSPGSTPADRWTTWSLLKKSRRDLWWENYLNFNLNFLQNSYCFGWVMETKEEWTFWLADDDVIRHPFCSAIPAVELHPSGSRK